MQKTGDNVIWYTYDENGLVTGFRYNGSQYYYFRNAQNDIIGIVNSSGSVVANYTYDSWGNHIAITDGSGNDVSNNPNHIANINPFRYRGYYYDTETGLYYLNSRYYDANVGRFINADSYISTGQGVLGYNMFAYCLNNPVSFIDSDGKNAILLQSWASTMWWLCAADTVLPVGDIIYVGGLVVLGIIAVGTCIASESIGTTWNIPNLFAKKSKKSNKERSTDKPSWVNKDMVDSSISAQENAKRILDDKFGNGNWNKGPNSDYNKIVKWIHRSLGAAIYVPDGLDSSGEFFYNDFGNLIYWYYCPNYDMDSIYSSYKMYAVVNGEFVRIFE